MGHGFHGYVSHNQRVSVSKKFKPLLDGKDLTGIRDIATLPNFPAKSPLKKPWLHG